MTNLSIDTLHEFSVMALDAVTLYEQTIADFLTASYEINRDHAYRVIELISFEHLDIEQGSINHDYFYVNNDPRYMIDIFNVSDTSDACILAYLNPMGLELLIKETK